MQVDKQYNKVKFCAITHASSKKSLLFVQFWAARGFCQRVQNSRICQRCDVKTSTVIPTFYYFFIIFMTCFISVPSFIYNLCYVLLLRNHLNASKGKEIPPSPGPMWLVNFPDQHVNSNFVSVVIEIFRQLQIRGEPGKNSGLQRDSNPWPLRQRWSALPFEL